MFMSILAANRAAGGGFTCLLVCTNSVHNIGWLGRGHNPVFAEVKRDIRQMGPVLTVSELGYSIHASRSVVHLALCPWVDIAWAPSPWTAADRSWDLLARDCRLREEVQVSKNPASLGHRWTGAVFFSRPEPLSRGGFPVAEALVWAPSSPPPHLDGSLNPPQAFLTSPYP